MQGVCRDDATSRGGGNLQLAPFRFDVTPPMGHSCCGGWITPVMAVDDALEAVGFVLLGAGQPIVVCAVDWTELLNEAHVEWRRALAEVDVGCVESSERTGFEGSPMSLVRSEDSTHPT